MDEDIYRSRLDVPLDKKVLKYLSSLKDDIWIIEEDIIGTEAHNIMLYEQKIITKQEIIDILRSLEEIKNDYNAEKLKIDKDYEDIHPLIEDLVIQKIGIKKGGKLHTGRSRNDQVSLDIRLKIRKELNLLTSKLIRFFDTLEGLSNKTIDAVLPLYTHLQRGQLGVFAHYINNYLSQIIRNIDRTEEVYRRINKNPLGACAIGGTSIRINRKRTTELLGFDGIVYNSIDAISSRDYIYETLSLLSLISLQFSRIAEDLLLWSSKEFNFIDLDGRYCSVSSVMPQKKNPDTLELTRSKCAQVISECINSALIIKSIPTGYFRDFQDLKPLLINSFRKTHQIIEILTGIFSTININTDIMKKVVNNSFLLALDLAELFVQEFNIPFREAHNIIGNLVNISKNTDGLFNVEKINASIRKYTDKKIELTEDHLKNIKDLENCLSRRISKGSPSPKEIEAFLSNVQTKRQEKEKNLKFRKQKIKKAKEERQKIIDDLIS